MTVAFAHRILSRAAGRPVKPGEPAEVAIDRALLSGARAPAILLKVRDLGGPWSPDQVILSMDFVAPEVESVVPRSRSLCRELADAFSLRHVMDLNAGIGSHAVVESARVMPGQIVAGCGRCLAVTGGIGALGWHLDDAALAHAVHTGRATLTVPPAVRVVVRGKPPRQAGPIDIAAAAAAALAGQLAGRIVEFTGETAAWPLNLRLGVCGILLEMGAATALIPPDDMLAKFYQERGESAALDMEPAGDDAYEASVTLTMKELPAVIGATYVGSFSPLPKGSGLPVQGAFIGSCYGGRYEDLALVAEVLKKAGHVHPAVRLAISPATLETARACLQAGFYETFLQAGAMVGVPGAGPGSAGGVAIFGEGERIASTAEYHRQLSPGQGLPEVHLLSPAAAAVAAATGELVDPAVYLA
jgi:3-isopropylmalate/(R)-2-methylmalate dehydratase large subunit